ncbi:MAG: baseplate J/gp47 family protein [bacterium]|nr:baseplate J/gp47 family protein [bacterium]
MSRFSDIAEVDFLDGITLSSLKENAIEKYKEAYREVVGEATTSVPDEIKAVLYADAQILYQTAVTVSEAAKKNLLQYADGKFLDNLVLRNGLTRTRGEKAVTTVRFTVSALRDFVIAIPEGTRVTEASGKAVFATVKYAEIAPGETNVDVVCTANSAGAAMNNISVGELCVLADPIAYIGSVSNTAIPTGGSDEETDTHLAQRAFAARYMYSTTGAEKAYAYFIMSYSTLIRDVVVVCEKDAEIMAYITLADGTQANGAFLEEVRDYVSAPERKPLTDKVTILNAPRVNYEVDIKYSISEDDVSRVTEINGAVAAAVDEYIKWQSSSIGLDIDPQQLIALCRTAGARNIQITAPAAQTVTQIQIAHCTGVKTAHAGIISR